VYVPFAQVGDCLDQADDEFREDTGEEYQVHSWFVDIQPSVRIQFVDPFVSQKSTASANRCRTRSWFSSGVADDDDPDSVEISAPGIDGRVSTSHSNASFWHEPGSCRSGWVSFGMAGSTTATTAFRIKVEAGRVGEDVGAEDGIRVGADGAARVGVGAATGRPASDVVGKIVLGAGVGDAAVGIAPRPEEDGCCWLRAIANPAPVPSPKATRNSSPSNAPTVQSSRLRFRTALGDHGEVMELVDGGSELPS
jgi:hypothetical protein